MVQGAYANPSFQYQFKRGLLPITAFNFLHHSNVEFAHFGLFRTYSTIHAMSTADQVKEDYKTSADTYGGYGTLPIGLIESQIIKNALGDATGLIILDLGGGSGVHAREAIDAGAQRIDIVDISPEMMKIATDTEKSIGRKGRIRTFEADVSKPMDHLPLETYDVVMANWVFDHAGNVGVLEGMWENIAKYLKPGAMFLGIRAEDPRGPALTGQYGVRNKNIKEIPGGIGYTVEMLNDPVWEFEATSMEISFSGSFEMHEKYGLKDVSVVPYANTDAVRKDPEFWQLFLEHPPFAVVQGYKKE
jgi:SAM-dependent methyltransferase